jgi:uncharacterized protein
MSIPRRVSGIGLWKILALAAANICIVPQLGLGAEAAPHPPTHRQMVERAIDTHVLPQVVDFVGKAEALARVVASDCDKGGAEPVATVREAFTDAVLSWAVVSTDRIGPARKKDRATRIAFWPDPRSVVRRQVRQLLAKPDWSLAAPEAIARQSVGLQGLPALELLVFPEAREESAEEVRFRCALAAAIAANIATQAAEMHKGWLGAEGWRHKMLSTGPQNSLYKTDAEAAAEFVKSYLAAIEIIRRNELDPWQKAVEASRKSAGLPYERAGLSKKYLSASLASIHELHVALQLDEFAAVLAKKDPSKKWMVSWLKNAFASMDRDVAGLELPEETAAKGSTDTTQIRRLLFYTNGLRQIVGREIAPAAGLFLGFNELDGD